METTNEIDKIIAGIKPKNPKKFKYHLAKGSDWAILKDIANPDEPTYMQIYVENDIIRGIRGIGGIFVNDAFISLWNKTRGLLFLDGGYGSSKTTYVITRMLVKCLEGKYFRCFYGRQKKTEARELHKNIITEIKRNGWEERFDYSETPNGTTRITCLDNGNYFEMFGCDDVDSLKGIDNPTDIIVDEINQISFESFGMLWTRLRTPGYELQLVGMFNNCDVYPDHWIVKYIYGDDNPTEAAGKLLVDSLRKSSITRHHSTYLDNKFQNHEDYYNKLVIKAGGDPLKIKAYCNGDWGIKLDSQPYYKRFNQEVHVKYCSYRRDLPLEISWDENVNPYLPVIIAQVEGTTVYIIDEIAAENPNNTIEWVCKEINERYKGHTAGVNIYGDATSKKEDVKQEKGKNFFTLITGYLEKLFPRLRVPDSNPNNAMRGNFLNIVLGENYGGINVVISPKCKHLIMDLQHCPESPDGKGKDKTKQMVNGVRGVQRWGHFGDCFDYLMCEFFMWAYLMFQNGGVSYEAKGGYRVVQNSMDGLKVELPTEDLEEDEEFLEKLYYRRKTRNHMN